MGNEVWELNYIENTGTSTAPAFVQRTGGANPFDGIEAEFPALGDFDGDGSGRVRQSINCDRTFVFRAGDPDLVVDLRLVVGGDYYLDNDGTLGPRPSIDKLRSHVLCRSQVTWTSYWAMMACSSTWRTPGRLRRRSSCK